MKYILSIDGGGALGTAAAKFLELLEQDLEIPIHEKFDLYAGTSTGALIVLGFAGRKFSAKEVSQLYSVNNLQKIMNHSWWDRLLPIPFFKPKFDGRGKSEILFETFKDLKAGDIEKEFIITAYDLGKRQPRIFKKKDKDILIRDMADATSAAPTYFPSHKMQTGEYLIDGGVAANNPAMCAYAEARRLWPNEEIRVLSVGTGYKIRSLASEKTKKWGALKWLANKITEVLMDGPNVAVEYQCKWILGDNLVRVNSELEEVNDEMDDVSIQNIKLLKELGELWYDDFGKETLKLLKS